MSKEAEAAGAGGAGGAGAGAEPLSALDGIHRFRDARGLSIGTMSDSGFESLGDVAPSPVPNVGLEKMNDYFAAIPVTSFAKPPKGSVICVDSSASVKDAVDLMTEHNILSLPVRNSECKEDADHWDDKYLGMVTSFDIVHFALDHDHHVPSPSSSRHRKKGSGSHGLNLLKMMAKKSAFAMVRVGEVLDRAHRFRVGKLLAIPETGTLLDVLLILGKHGRHRIVVEDEHDITNIITQSAVLAMISEHLPALRGITDHTLQELGLVAPREIFTVGLDDEAKTAFKAMLEKHVSALPVLDSKGVIVGSISNRDIKATCKSSTMSEALHEPIRKFLEIVHSELDIRAPSITVHADRKLSEVVELLNATRVHRVYVLDDSDKVVSVVSLRDILTLFVDEPEGYFDDVRRGTKK